MVGSLTYKGQVACPLAFNEDRHEYRLRGQWRPGCTRILSDNGYSEGARFFTPESRQRGKAGHYAVQLANEHCPEALTLDEALEVIDLDERLQGYLAGYLLFRREKGFTPLHSELLVYSDLWSVCGKFDIWGQYADGRKVLVDLKTWKSQGPKPKRGATIQVAGYKVLLKECLDLDTDIAIPIALPGDGTYREFPSATPKDAQIFQANCLTWWDRRNSGLLEESGESEVDLAA